MAESLFSFLCATFYRWVQVWPEVCLELDGAPHLLAVGDLHVENFGTWRDTDGRLVPTMKGKVPESAREAIEHLLPQPGLKYRLARRVAGLGSLGHMRFVAIVEWRGGRVAREAKALVPSSMHWLSPERTPGEILYATVLKRAVRCADPYVQLRGHWIVRRLSPDCSRIELESLGKNRGELRLLQSMGWEAANIHLGTEEKRKAVLKDLGRRKGNWLMAGAEAMAGAMETDWRTWREHWKS